MLCPEGDASNVNKNDTPCEQQYKGSEIKDAEITTNTNTSFNNLKAWKKTFSKLFRHHSSRSNDGDKVGSSVSHDNVQNISPELKWQSLGKMFRRSTIRDWNKSEEADESSSHHKKASVKKVISSYFTKNVMGHMGQPKD